MRKSPRTQGSGSGADSLDTSANSAADALQALATIAEQLKGTLQALSQAPGGAGANPGAFFGAAGQLASVQIAQQTVQAGGSISPSVLTALTSSSGGGVGAATGGQPRDAQGRFLSSADAATMNSAGGAPAMAPIVAANAAGGGSGQGYVYGGFGAGGGGGGFAYPLNSAVIPTLQHGASLIGEGLNYATQQSTQGGSMIMERGRLMAGMTSTVAAAIGTAFGGPAMGAVVGGITNSILGPLSDYINAPAADRAGAQASLMPYGAARYGAGAQKWGIGEVGYDTTQNGARNGLLAGGHFIASGRLDHIVAGLHSRWAGTDMDAGENGRSVVAATYGALSSSLFAGGVDPDQGSGSTWGASIISPFESQRKNFKIDSGSGNLANSKFKLMTALIDVGGQAIINANMRKDPGGEESLSEAYTRRLGELVGTKQAPEVAKQIAPIFASLPETGRNITDILTRFGAQNTATALRITNDGLDTGIDPMKLAKVSADMRSDDRATQFASLQARGSGEATAGSLRKKLSDIEQMPDGKDSLVYAQTRAQLRGADRTAFDQEGMTKFGLPMTHLQGQLDRAEIMPFAPANVLKLSMQTAKLDQAEIGRLDAYVKKRKASGDLSESEELELAGRREGLLTDQARVQTQMSEGYMQRLPAMMANVPGRLQGRFTTPMMAANNMQMMGINNIWAFGAANGRHMQDQNAMFDDIGGAPSRATSRTGTSSLGGGDQARIAGLLEQILAALKNSGNRGGRTSDMLGQAGAALGRTETGSNNGGHYN